jgi:hypothetical protein
MANTNAQQEESRQQVLHIMYSHGAANEAVDAMLDFIARRERAAQERLLDELGHIVLSSGVHGTLDYIKAKRQALGEEQ